MNKDLREDIQNAKEHLYEMSNSALSVERIIKFAEQVLEAGENLPYQDTGNPVRDSEHNSVVDECLPTVAKLNLRVAELEGKIKKLSALNGVIGIDKEEL
jgi:phage shock protein A